MAREGTESDDRLPPGGEECGPRQIYYELLRALLRDRRLSLEEMAQWVPAELVFKALIIREFMEHNGIDDIRTGIRLFHAFQREKIRRFDPGPLRRPEARRRFRRRLIR